MDLLSQMAETRLVFSPNGNSLQVGAEQVTPVDSLFGGFSAYLAIRPLIGEDYLPGAKIGVIFKKAVSAGQCLVVKCPKEKESVGFVGSSCAICIRSNLSNVSGLKLSDQSLEFCGEEMQVQSDNEIRFRLDSLFRLVCAADLSTWIFAQRLHSKCFFLTGRLDLDFYAVPKSDSCKLKFTSHQVGRTSMKTVVSAFSEDIEIAKFSAILVNVNSETGEKVLIN